MPRKKVIDAPSSSPRSKTRFVFIGIIMVALLGAVLALFIGRTDSDAIDVSGIIQNSNAVAREAGGEGAVQQPVSTYQNLPNGGLIGKGDEGTPPPPVAEEVVASSTASSTEEVQSADEEEVPAEEIPPETPAEETETEAATE